MERGPAVDVATTALTAAEIAAGFRAVEPRVQDCRPINLGPDPITVRASVSKNGIVSAVTLQPLSVSPTVIACFDSAVREARFRASPGLTVDYVFLFRRMAAEGTHAPRDGGVDAQ
jgi:hypothetical protein